MGQGQLRQTTGDQVVLNYLSVDVLTNRQKAGENFITVRKLNKEGLDCFSPNEKEESTSINKTRTTGASKSKDKTRRSTSTRSIGNNASRQNRLKS